MAPVQPLVAALMGVAQVSTLMPYGVSSWLVVRAFSREIAEHPAFHFRAFVSRGRLTAVSQLYHVLFHPQLVMRKQHVLAVLQVRPAHAPPRNLRSFVRAATSTCRASCAKLWFRRWRVLTLRSPSTCSCGPRPSRTTPRPRPLSSSTSTSASSVWCVASWISIVPLPAAALSPARRLLA